MLKTIRCERGISLPLVLVVMMVLTISVLGIVQYTGANSRSASISFARQDARGIAEDGLNRAAAVLATNPTGAPGTVLPSCTAAGVPTPPATVGTSSRCGIRTGPDASGIYTWTLKSTGSAANPSGPAGTPRMHTVSADFQVTQSIGAWEFVYIEPSGGDCADLKNDFVMNSPMYVKGNLCLQNNAQFRGPRLYVTGTVQVKDSGTIGLATARIPHVSVRNNAPAASGCRFPWSGAYVLPCGTAQRVHTDVFDTDVPPVQRPPADFPFYYANSKPGPLNGCTVYSGAISHPTNFFDNNTTRNNSNADRDLMPSGQSYNCERWEGGVLKGRIAWNHSTRVFTIESGPGEPEPKFFFDGKVLLNNGGNVLVQGRGTIYVNDIFKISNNTRVCAVVVSCQESTWNAATDTWNPNISTHALLFIIAGNTDANAIEIETNSRYQGGLYSMGGINVKGGSPGAQVQGPIVALGAEVQNGADLRPWPWFTDLPDGVPSYGTPHLTFVPGSWRG